MSVMESRELSPVKRAAIESLRTTHGEREYRAALKRATSPVTRPSKVVKKKRVSSYLATAKKRNRAARRDLAADRARARRALVLSPFGEDWVVDTHTLHSVILQVEVGHAKGPADAAIKAWVWRRADDLGQAEHVPPQWKNPALLAAYIENHDPATASSSVGGQQ